MKLSTLLNKPVWLTEVENIGLVLLKTLTDTSPIRTLR